MRFMCSNFVCLGFEWLRLELLLACCLLMLILELLVIWLCTCFGLGFYDGVLTGFAIVGIPGLDTFR